MPTPLTTRRPRTWVAVALLAVGLAATACSGSSDAADRSDGKPTTTTEVAAATEPATASTPAEPTDGCGREPDVATLGDDRPGDVEQAFTSDGVERLYRLGVPASYDPEVPAPLVVNLHGSGSDALQASIYGDVPREAAKRGMITVAPQSIGGKWELGGDGNDHEFLDALVDDIEARYCIDAARVHIIGMSLGAWKAAVTACATPGRYASISLVTVEVFPGTCDLMPVIAFHGTADTTVAYGEGGGTVDDAVTPNVGIPGTLTNIAAWADNGGCDPDPEISEIGEDVELRAYVGCDEGVGVELYTIGGGGHTWPGSDIIIGPESFTTATIDATNLSLDWFEAHPA